MCGILGGLSRRLAVFNSSKIEEAIHYLDHRGPDSKSFVIFDNVFLAHTRLSIVDLSNRSNQPMTIEHCSIVFNGEIYNYKSVRDLLEKDGCQFMTDSDTEVVLKSYQRYGSNCLDFLEGMFAFSIFDQENKTFFLARDRFGEKPLFYYFDDELFLFSSEIPPLVSLLNSEKKTIDLEAIRLYFRHSYIPGSKTPYKNMFQLKQSCYLSFNIDNWKLDIESYYELNSRVRVWQGSYDQAKKKIRDLLENSVRERLLSSDVPVATFLSGGIDSTIITEISSRFSCKKLNAYTIYYPNDPEFDESHFAIQAAKKFSNVDHRLIPVTQESLIDFIDEAINRLGEPYADSSIVPTSYLCSHVEEKVILGGDGADELFGGYGVYSSLLFSVKLPAWVKLVLDIFPTVKNPASLKNTFLRKIFLYKKNFSPDVNHEYRNWRSYCDDFLLDQLIGLPASAKSENLILSLKDIQLLDFDCNLPGDLLKKIDYAGMFQSLEIRSPFLDSQLVEFVMSLPDSYKIHRDNRKKILKDAFKGLIPAEILYRRKQGFLLPVKNWFKEGSLLDKLYAMLSKQNSIDPKLILKLLDEHQRSVNDHSVILWSVFIYLSWINRLN